MIFPFYYFILLGIVTGIASGLFGIGGGLLMVPLLMFFFKVPQNTASGTSLVAMLLPVGALGVFQYYRSNLITIDHIKMGLWIAFGIFFGTFLGAKISVVLPTKILSRLFSALMIFGAYKLWK